MISIGVDIGKFSVNVALVEGSSKGFQVIGLDEIPLGQDPAKDQTIDIIEALREIKKRYVSEDTPVVISTRQNHLSLRRLQFPFKERHKILKSLPFELEDDIPFSLENAVFEAKVTHTLGGQPQVLAMACPNTHVEDCLQRFQDAGLEPQILSSEAVAIANLFEEWRESPKDLSLATGALPEASPAHLKLHIGHTETVGVILQDGYLLDAFTVDWGGKDLADLLAIKYGIHYVEALKELRKKAFVLIHHEGATKEQITLSDILKSSINEFSNQLRLSILELQSRHGVKVQDVTLSGGVANLRNLGPYLTQKLEVAVNRLDHVALLPQLDFVSNPKNEISHVVSIGLAIEGLRRPKNPAVNFLKGDYARQSESLRLFWDKWAPAANTVLAIFVVFLVWSFFRDIFTYDMMGVAETRLKGHAENVAGLTGRQASPRNIRKFIRDQDQKIMQREVLESLQGVTSALDILSRVSSLAPTKNSGQLNVIELFIDSSQLRIVGYANRPEIITQFQNTLKSLAANGNVDVSTPPKSVPTGQRGFQFTLNVERRSGASR